jgi:hypothetical protein
MRLIQRRSRGGRVQSLDATAGLCTRAAARPSCLVLQPAETRGPVWAACLPGMGNADSEAPPRRAQIQAGLDAQHHAAVALCRQLLGRHVYPARHRAHRLRGSGFGFKGMLSDAQAGRLDSDLVPDTRRPMSNTSSRDR